MLEAQVALAGEAEPVAALQAAFRTEGIRASVLPADGLAADLTELERRLADERPHACVSVGTSEGALAFAITAAKLGIPLAACLDGSSLATDGTAAATRRILSTLAGLATEASP